MQSAVTLAVQKKTPPPKIVLLCQRHDVMMQSAVALAEQKKTPPPGDLYSHGTKQNINHTKTFQYSYVCRCPFRRLYWGCGGLPYIYILARSYSPRLAWISYKKGLFYFLVDVTDWSFTLGQSDSVGRNKQPRQLHRCVVSMH